MDETNKLKVYCETSFWSYLESLCIGEGRAIFKVVDTATLASSNVLGSGRIEGTATCSGIRRRY